MDRPARSAASVNGTPSHDIEVLRERARQVIESARRRGAVVRLAGGVGVRERAGSLGGIDLGNRPYRDIDFVGRLRDVRAVDASLDGLGYTADRVVNAQFGTVRRVYHHPDGYHVDLFLDRLDFCHRIELLGRLELHALTLTPADLLLAKMQIVERNRKDLIDAALLLHNHDLVPSDPSAIELDRILTLTSNDWGLCATAGDFLDVLRASLPGLGFDEEPVRSIESRAAQLATAITAAPKSLRWRTRDRIGRRVRWYREVEEVL